MDSVTQLAPLRLSIVCASLGELPLAALEFLVLSLNTRQSDVEFQFIAIDKTDPFLASLGPGRIVRLADFESGIAAFLERTKVRQQRSASRYGFQPSQLGRFLILSIATLDVHFYELWRQDFSALFLGDWESAMAPPSLLEFLLSLVMMEGLYLAVPGDPTAFSHLETRGCIGDFNPTLRDARYKILLGHLCSECRDIACKVCGDEFTQRWSTLLSKSWIGTLADPTSAATTVSKLGYNLFLTRGYAPTPWERLKESLQEEGVSEVLKLLGGLVLAGLLFWLGLNK